MLVIHSNVVYHDEGRTRTLGYKNIISLFFLRVKASVVWERTSPYYAVLSSAPSPEGTQPETVVDRCPSWALSVTACSLLTTSWDSDWQAATPTATDSRGHLHTSLSNSHIFPIKHVIASAYLHWCVLCRESLIDGSVKDQCAKATLGTI